MASSYLTSDPEALFQLMQDLPDKSGSEDEFDGYLEPEDRPVAYCRADFECKDVSLRKHSLSLEDLSESPLGPCSPSLSPMQVQNAGGSPLPFGSPSHSLS